MFLKTFTQTHDWSILLPTELVPFVLMWFRKPFMGISGISTASISWLVQKLWILTLFFPSYASRMFKTEENVNRTHRGIANLYNQLRITGFLHENGPKQTWKEGYLSLNIWEHYSFNITALFQNVHFSFFCFKIIGTIWCSFSWRKTKNTSNVF